MNQRRRIKRRVQMRVPTWAARLAAVAPDARRDDTTLLVPPTRSGSLGDEAMMTVCMERLRQEGQRFGIADFAAGDRWPDEPPETKHIDFSGFFGATYVRSLPGAVRALREFDRLWCLGADVMDGHYSEVGSLRRIALAHLAADLGLEVSILGFSFNESPRELVVEALRQLPSSVGILARDPISHARLIKHLGRPICLVADVAFGLEVPYDLDLAERDIIEWVRTRHMRGDRVVGLNVSHRAFKSIGRDDASEAIDAYASALTTFLRRHSDVSIVCIPHDYRGGRDEMSDPELLAAIAHEVDPEKSQRILVPHFRLHAPFVKNLVGEVDAVLSGRMHLVIAALGQGTPASGLSYQGKLAGLYEHFRLPDLALEPSHALTRSGLTHALDRLLDDSAALSARIAERKRHIEALQQRNFDTSASPKNARRLLVISPEATHPTDKGNRMRIMDLCDRAGRLGWEVHLAHIERGATDRELMLAHWGDRYHPLPYRHPVRLDQKVARRVRGAISGNYEIGIDDWYDTDIDAYLLALQRRYAFDAVMVEYAHQSKAFTMFGDGVLKILDTHDELANRFARQEAFGRPRRGFSTTPEQESIGLSRSDVVLAIQDIERERFQSRTTSEVVTVGHHVPLIAPPSKRFEARLLFLGSRNQANVDAIEFFLDSVWPSVSNRMKLLIAGSICDLINAPKGVEQMPVLDDLAEAYDLADVVVVPMRFGTGLKVKTIEALGRGKPTVSTRAGAEGLERGHGTAILIADEPEDFVAALCSLIEDRERREALSRAALDFARAWNDEAEAAFAAVLAGAVSVQAAD